MNTSPVTQSAAELEARRVALLASRPTSILIGAAQILEASAAASVRLTSEERLTLAWISDELERRGGGITDDERFDALLDAEGATYLSALLAYFPSLTA